jgi:hypothetical protein
VSAYLTALAPGWLGGAVGSARPVCGQREVRVGLSFANRRDEPAETDLDILREIRV